jgi:hypothetical protein
MIRTNLNLRFFHYSICCANTLLQLVKTDSVVIDDESSTKKTDSVVMDEESTKKRKVFSCVIVRLNPFKAR